MKENPKFQMAAFALSIALSKGLSLIMLPIFTRFLSPAEMGELELVATTMAVLGILISFALHEALYRFATRNGLTRANQIFTLTFGLSLICSIFALALVTGVGEGQLISQSSLYILAISLSIESPLAICMVWLRMQDKTITFIKISLGIALIQALCVLLALNLGYGVQGVLLSAFMAHLVQLLCSLHSSKLRITRPSKRLVKVSLKYCLPLMLSGLVAFGLNGSERWIIASNTSLEVLGQYAIAAKFALAMCFLIQPFGMWWMPKRIKLAKEHPEQATSYTQMGITLVGMLAMCVLCFGQLFIQYALPEVYHPSALLLVGTLLMALGKEWGELLNLGSLVKGRTLPLFWINLGVVILALSSLFMHQELSIWTIMLTLGMAQLGRALIIFFISQRAYSLPFNLSKLSIALVLPLVGLLLAYQGITPWLILLALALQLTLGNALGQRQGVSA